MPNNTYVALATTTLSSSQGLVSFTSIPQGYTDLRLVYNGTGSATVPFALQFNSDTGSNYSYTILYGSGSSAASTRGSNQTEGYLGNVWTDQNTIIVDIMNYSNTTTYKTQISRANSAGNRVAAWVNLWRSTAAITRIDITATGGGSYQTGSTFTLYGIAAASVGAKATGGTIYQDASYFYHVFSGNGTFTPSQSISADVLCVAGGGGGGASGGGGGAGGLRSILSSSFTATNYTVTVGAGGAGGGPSSDAPGTKGGNSSISTISATGGGYGSGSGGVGGVGGSGGGTRAYNTSAGAAGNQGGYSPVEGYAAGNGASSGGGSGGGGAGGVGSNASNTGVSGNGGIGIYNSLTDAIGLATGLGELSSSHYYFAGGAGGGSASGQNSSTGGTGGGGYGGREGSRDGAVGAAYTGGGGGGGFGTAAGVAGGSGVVVVRYAK